MKEGLIRAIGGAVKSFLEYQLEIKIKITRKINCYDVYVRKYNESLVIWFFGRKYVEAKWNARVIYFDTVDELLVAIGDMLDVEEEKPHYFRNDLKINVDGDDGAPTPYPSPVELSERKESVSVFKGLLQYISDAYRYMMIPKIDGGIKRLRRNPNLKYVKIYINPFQLINVRIAENISNLYRWDEIHYGPCVSSDSSWFDRNSTYWSSHGAISPFAQLQQYLRKNNYDLQDLSTVEKYVDLRLSLL
ncbi:MAG: hypothetical protein Harvfovirus1_14 [Harvfovirus sp.]|uniref:Uncharacterized protein n=1 Tax=Harvfovirus sp. TaxID=2487768 RepID=A0A3G5A4J3_9VIRU|nr:MAG: hypothetical protein Harvfovirus1_14 [Harvfovirus sp.]